MEWLPKDIVAALLYLTPGFLTAWIFYGLTAYAKPAPFERIVQALIFTAIVQLLTLLLARCTYWVGDHYFAWGTWTQDCNLFWSMLFACALGLAISWCANWDTFHKKMRDWGLTSNTSYPSEWFSGFKQRQSNPWVILHFKKKKRRLYGWAQEWPDDPDSGQFQICHAYWLSVDGDCASLENVDFIVIPAVDVSMVEFVNHPPEECNDDKTDNNTDVRIATCPVNSGGQQYGIPVAEAHSTSETRQSRSGEVTGTTDQSSHTSKDPSTALQEQVNRDTRE